MKHSMHRKVLLVVAGSCLFLLIFLLTIGILLPTVQDLPSQPAETDLPPTSTGRPSSHPTTPTTLPPPTFQGEVAENSQGQLSFCLTADGLIELYNHHFTPPMRPLAQWLQYPNESSVCHGIPCTRYAFLADPQWHSCPPIFLYIQDRTGQILEISLSLSQHDWTQTLENYFETQCLRMLSLFFPQLDADQVRQLYMALFQDAHENAYISHADIPRPKALRTAGNVGCYGYIYRGMICIHLIPVSSSTLSQFRDNGIQILPIEGGSLC